MATRALPRSLRLPTLRSITKPYRSFITLPSIESQSLSASRILPYNSNSLYSIIADVDSYSSFIPYCVASRVTSWSAPDANGRRWPSLADLKVGWGGVDEQYTSRLYCVPGSIVEALGGDAVTQLKKSDIAHHDLDTALSPTANSVFKSLRTRWTVRPLLHSSGFGAPTSKTTDVRLTIDFQFTNPIYAVMSKAAAPRLAAVMIEAFEERARKLLGGQDELQGRLPAKKIGA